MWPISPAVKLEPEKAIYRNNYGNALILATRTEEDKLVNALRKSWQKMTPAAHAHALRLPFGTQERSLLERALSTPPPPPG